jgi:hypothetical protein
MVTILVDEMQCEHRCTHRFVVEGPADMNGKKGKSSGYARVQEPVGIGHGPWASQLTYKFAVLESQTPKALTQ